MLAVLLEASAKASTSSFPAKFGFLITVSAGLTPGCVQNRAGRGSAVPPAAGLRGVCPPVKSIWNATRHETILEDQGGVSLREGLLAVSNGKIIKVSFRPLGTHGP
jgi:hypothetical protein